ncbi:MAG TPA: hypothetical protein VGK74_09500 [Symbiobacteriaceae bacterium]|jgi:hypothetical protein
MNQEPSVLARTLVGAIAGLSLAFSVIVLLATWDVVGLEGVSDPEADIVPETERIVRRILMFFPAFGAATANIRRS